MISPMIRTRSFAEILDDVALQSEEEPDSRSHARQVFGSAGQGWLSSLFTEDQAPAELGEPGVQAFFFYDEETAEPFASISESTEEDRIAAELGLAAAATMADLARARRAFALRNHPDLFHPRLRAKANRRMQVANMLLDRRRREIEAGR